MQDRNVRKYSAIIPLVIVFFFYFRGASLASLPEKTLEIPAQYGSIKESFKAPGNRETSKRLIIQVQDAHCNYEAQKNMAGLLEYLIKNNNLSLIMVEGGSGDVNLSFLRGYADKKAREEVADKYLRQGKISGEEYLDIVSDYKIQLYGIEDEDLYKEHLASFEKVDSFRQKGLKDLESLTRIVETLKPYIYSAEIRRLEEQKKKYEEKALSLSEYCRFLKEMAAAKGVNLDKYIRFVSFAIVARLEKDMDYNKVELERNNFIKDLAGLLDENGAKNLINMTQGFKAKIASQEQYYSFLKRAAEGKLNISNYPQFNAYINYLTASQNVDVAGLLEELSAVESKIQEACFITADQKKLAEISKTVQILVKVLNLELVPEDYEYFQANRSKLATASWVDFLTQNCNKYNLAMLPLVSVAVDQNLEEMENFYKLGSAREKAFVKNMEDKINESGEKTVVLIAGGFHTPGVSQMLKEKGYSYAVVAPVITQQSDSSIYFSVLRGENKEPEESVYEEEGQ
jgi:hypothetical protein